MDAELERVAQIIKQAQLPEDLFGDLKGTPEQQHAEAKRLYRRLTKVVHPDRYREDGDKALAGEAFKKLTYLREAADRKIDAGTYGDRTAGLGEPVRIITRKREFVVGSQLARGDICTLFHCSVSEGGVESRGIFKVAREPHNNDLVVNEARVLKVLLANDDHDGFRPYIPTLVDSFRFRDGGSAAIRQANILSWLEGLYSLKEVMAYYPNGVDPKDMAWIWRRLLFVLGFAHVNSVIHGAVLPTHVLIHPEQHGLVLVDWSAAAYQPETSGERVKVISTEYKPWYPPEVAAKEMPTPGLDIFMGARCMMYLLGGNPVTGNLPDRVPKAIRAFFKGCALMGPSLRPQDAWGLKDEFDELIERLWGRRKFHNFAVPPRK